MQHRFIKFRDSITSEGANAKFSGIIAASVYRGFDRIIDPVGLSFKIDHELTGEIYTNINQSISPRMGSWVTKQGVSIKEDAPLAFSIDTNLGNGSDRTDLLVGKHYHDKLMPGGIAATYQIIKGANGTDLPPDISGNPDISQMVIIGSFRIRANGTSMAAVTWTRNRAPSLGGKTPALLNEANAFTDIQSFAQAPDVQVAAVDFENPGVGHIAALDGGNTFIVNTGFGTLDVLPNKPNGTRIVLLFKDETIIRGMVSNLIGGIVGMGVTVGYSAGYRAISIRNAENVTYKVTKGQAVVLEKVNLKGAFNPGTQTYEWGEVWKLISVSDNPERIALLEVANTATQAAITSLNNQITGLVAIINNINPPRLIQDIDFIGNFLEHFDNTGKAKSTSPYYGRAICNGQNGTPDYRGRFRVSYSDVEYEYSSVGFIGGEKFVTLTPGQMPKHRHYMFGHRNGNNPLLNIYPNEVPAWATNKTRGNQDYDMVTAGSGDFNYIGLTRSEGEGQQHENRPPYRVALTLMWIGVPA